MLTLLVCKGLIDAAAPDLQISNPLRNALSGTYGARCTRLGMADSPVRALNLTHTARMRVPYA